MKIEIAEPGRMTQTGSSLLKLIQNNDMPVLDLLVRESIQNSLDARKEGSKFVEVKYITGSFSSIRLAGELEGITESLSQKYSGNSYEFIAVRDSQTTGLTGETDYKRVRNNEYGNLLKLVYEICKPQDAAGSGGSWGIGKTVYFRIGAGLVIYYSRIKTENGQYESRLAASYVENETSASALIPVYKGQSKRGIAWWGKRTGENETQPETDENEIRRFLDIFDIPVYAGEDTGTTIIIPYIDPEKLLSNNQVEYLDAKGRQERPWWCGSIEDYISISAQRWYSPRMSNTHYTHGAYLRFMVNGNGIGRDSMEPVFRVVQALYNRANHIEDEDIFTGTGIEVKTENIRVLKYLDEPSAGNVAFAKVKRDVLGMDAPTNKPEPYRYFNCEVRDADVNMPTVCFTRKPGMIVSYENIGPWTSSISPTSKDEYIIAVFVLNSWNTLKDRPEEKVLEEYVRKSEMADHTSWSDWSDGAYNPRLIVKIQNGVNRVIGKEFAPQAGPEPPRQNSGLGKMFGDMLLPPDGFGKNPGPGPGPGPGSGTRRNFVFRPITQEITYNDGGVMIPFILETGSKKGIDNASMQIQIDSESKRIEVNEWESHMGMDTPFSVKEYRIELLMVDAQKLGNILLLSDSDDTVTATGITFRKLRTEKGTCDGLQVITEEPHTMKVRITAAVSINRNDIKPAFIFVKGDSYGR